MATGVPLALVGGLSRDEDDGNAELTGLFRYEDLLIAARRGTRTRRPLSAPRGW
ncbi:hypothetical protein ACH4ZU_32000 [Streptomyces sp. NPDC020472]|uniref:hypothetical protein n=1 Tax=unclassified Streptomyces TaxID=2593676 RepID=UPI0036C2BA4D